MLLVILLGPSNSKIYAGDIRRLWEILVDGKVAAKMIFSLAGLVNVLHVATQPPRYKQTAHR